MKRRRHSFVLASVVVVSSLAAGCGGGGGGGGGAGGSAGVASVPSTTTRAATPPGGLLAFSRCMRSNGVPSFPDPQRFVGGNVKLTIHQLGSGSPRFQAAMSACGHLLPTRGGGAQETPQQLHARLADELSFARCMRSHGVARFPDPTAQGQLSVEMVQSQGIDVHSPAVLHVVQACLPASHGALTAAKVQAALSQAGG